MRQERGIGSHSCWPSIEGRVVEGRGRQKWRSRARTWLMMRRGRARGNCSSSSPLKKGKEGESIPWRVGSWFVTGQQQRRRVVSSFSCWLHHHDVQGRGDCSVLKIEAWRTGRRSPERIPTLVDSPSSSRRICCPQRPLKWQIVQYRKITVESYQRWGIHRR